MNKFTYTFRRYEKKYVISDEQKRQLIQRIAARMRPDDYGETVICNLYYDTPDYLLIRRSLDKPLYKEKLRLRCYGVPKGDSTTFIEVKKKFKKVVYKRRLDTTYKKAVDYLAGAPLDKEGQIKNEMDWFLKSYNALSPSMALFYIRTAMFDNENPNLRITFDKDLFWRNYDLDLSLGAYGKSLLQAGQNLMEIKIPGAMPIWLAATLSELKIYPRSYSKYGNAFKTVLNETNIFGGNNNAR